MRLLGMLALGMAMAGFPDAVCAQNNPPPPNASPALPAQAMPGPPDSAKAAVSSAASVQQAFGDPQKAQDSSLAEPAVHKSRSDTVLVVKHSFNHRQQIIAGSVIMTCLMLMMVTMNNYNPR